MRMDDERLQWPPCSVFDRTVCDCLHELESTDVYPWQVVWYLLQVFLPDTAARMKPYMSCSSAMMTILQHKIGSEPLQISFESLSILLQCLSGQAFFRALDVHAKGCSAAFRDLFVEARLGLITLLWEQADDQAPFLLYELMIQLLRAHSSLSLIETCTLLFIPGVSVDTALFAQFLIEIGELLSPNLSVIDTKEKLVEVALLRSVFSLTLLLYAAAPPTCLKAIIYSDLFLATYLPYQFISPMHFALSLCNLLLEPTALSLSMRTMISELILESLNSELTSTLSLMPLTSVIEEGSRISTTCCGELLRSALALLCSETSSLDESHDQSMGLLAVSAFPCMPDYTASMTHLSAPFVELSLLMKDFNSRPHTSNTKSDALFAVSIPPPLMGDTTEVLAKHFSALASQSIWHQAILLAACFQIVAGRLNLEPCGDSSSINLPALNIEVLTTFLGRLFATESDAVPSALINLDSPMFLSSFHSIHHRQLIGDLYYLQISPRLGRINSIKLWNLLLFNNANLFCTRPLVVCDNDILISRGKAAADLLDFMLSGDITGSEKEKSSRWCSKWMDYLLDVTSMTVRTMSLKSLSSEIPVFLIFSFTLSLQYMSHISTISKMQLNNHTSGATNDVITFDMFVKYLSSTWTLYANPSISAILLLDAYSCDFHDDGLVAMSTVSVLQTLYPVLPRADLNFYNKVGASFLGTTKSVIEFYKRGVSSPLHVVFMLLYIIVPETFPPIHILLGYLLAFSLCPTYQTALPLILSTAPGCLGTYLMNQESVLLSMLYELQTRGPSGNRSTISSLKQRLWRALDKYVASIHCMTLYVSLLIYVSTYELSLLKADQSTGTISNGDSSGAEALERNLKSLLLQHLVGISTIQFTSVITSQRILFTMRAYVISMPALFLDISDSFLERLHCSSITMTNLVHCFSTAWAHSPFIKAVIDPSSFFASLVRLDLEQYCETGNSAQTHLWLINFPKTLISSIEAVVASGAHLSNDTVSDTFTDLLINVLFMAYNTESISRSLTGAHTNDLAAMDGTANSCISTRSFFAHLYQIQIGQFVLELFLQLSHITVLSPTKLPKQPQVLENINLKLEPSIKKQGSSTQTSSTPYTANRYLLYLQLADTVASLCVRVANLYRCKSVWPKARIVRQTTTTVISGVSQVLASVDKVVIDTYLRYEQHGLHPQLQELLCCSPSSLCESENAVTRMRLFCSTEVSESLLTLGAIEGGAISYMKVYCDAWRLLICAAWIASSVAKGADYNHIPASIVLYHGGLTVYTYCLLRGLFLAKARKNKFTLQAALRSYSQRCTSAKHRLSLSPFYIPGWQPAATDTLPVFLTASSSVLHSSLATLRSADIPFALVHFSGAVQHPGSDIIGALTTTLLAEEDSAGELTVHKVTEPACN